MGRLTRTLGPAVPIAIAVVVWLIALVAAPVQSTPVIAAAKVQEAAAPAQATGYVGEEMCLTCHEDKSYKGTAHAFKVNERTPAAGNGCESCHGPGQAHVDGGGDKTKIQNPSLLSPAAASETCVTCHNRAEHAVWTGSQHDQRNVGCTTCHSIHSPVSEAGQLKARSESDLCAKCHRDKTNKLNRFNHMPVRESKMTCSACHNPHGSANVRLLKKGVTLNESCTSCHTEKRGPMLWEHPPVAENCTTCHDAHGTNNDRMLVAKQPFLCQRCHVTSRHPPTVYDGYLLKNSTNANKIFGRSCMNCHQLVHGSNAPVGKAFLR